MVVDPHGNSIGTIWFGLYSYHLARGGQAELVTLIDDRFRKKHYHGK
jgi:hypothetical protein